MSAMIWYLNLHWRPQHGGQLRLYPERDLDSNSNESSATLDIEPVMGAVTQVLTVACRTSFASCCATASAASDTQQFIVGSVYDL